jgi:hypothetical protein
MKIQYFTKGMAVLLIVLSTGCFNARSQPVEHSVASASAATNSGPASTNKQEIVAPPGGIKLVNDPLPQFLDLYSSLTGAKVDTSQLGTTLPPVFISFTNEDALTRPELARHLDKALFDQAGIVAEHQDPTHVVLRHRTRTDK